MTDRTGPPSPPGGEHPGCQQVREDAAVALLGRRAPDPDTRAHLRACPPCHDEFRQLAALPPLLDVAGPTIAHPPTPPNPLLLDRLLTELGRRRRRRRVITAMAAAVAVLAVVLPAARLVANGSDGDDQASAPRTSSTTGGGGASSSGGTGSSGGTAPSRGTAPTEPGGVGGTTAAYATGTGTDAASGISVQVALHTAPGGSELRVSVHGMRAGSKCRLLVRDTAGHTVPAGDWTVDEQYRGPYIEEIPLAAPVVSRVDVLDDRTGRRLVSVAMSRA